ncbi:PEP/pyruvate-binding domain-containing protein [Gordonia terrae]|uniref:Pyruvate, water dikinase n=2 Tax=Gordonia terrae TaxID=2055 RepID=A0AAD0KAD3_9ACTN|nr:PEP/pyruvate-binding domain-containing protein [Gordonia terrae]VTR08007.1 pyruvate phosphate dikinase PEP/pyruvate-binding protein [Clostridioides difficile]ANY25150.1 pyruvate, water dikinase [Gordonia terrae]AWO85895.1 pyruvate, water dikinase [Gordonia terrae]VTS61906.1 Phosphoenolpyruvate synthase [Gordonia terrae]GAB45478.1 putative pyruvate, water dikinase [Gordonia terrae NBRC 100016]
MTQEIDVTPSVVEFDDIVDDRYGGKAAGLAELRRLGLPVPTGFVIADASVDGALDDVTARFGHLVAAGTTPVAVRSSAVGEDGDDQSFAGQYDTVLGVDSVDAFTDAVRRCAASVHSRRASAYSGHAAPTMHVVVQRMVDARAAGVVFTADPTSGRRDLMVIDAVAGLGEALVDGSAAPDHLVLDVDGNTVVHESVAAPVLSPDEIAQVRAGALRTAQHWGRPMDLEWAIDEAGELWWLQARPITTLPGDLNEMDSPLAGADHVYTRCNIGEMMPGAFCPLTASVSGFAIDYAMQMVQVVARAQESYEKPWLQVGYFYGHMFLNLTEGTALSSGIIGNSLEQFSMSICGRVIDELTPKPAQPFRRKLGNTIRLTSHALSVGPAIRRLPAEIAAFPVPTSRDPRVVLQQLETGVEQYRDVTLTHVRSSSRAAVAANVLEGVLVRQAVKDGRTEEDGKAQAARLMAGASEVESAMMLAELDAVVHTIAADPAVAREFLAAAPDDAVIDLRSASGDAGRALRHFLEWHGHRGYRELCMRDPSWADDPGGLGAMMQVMVRSALDPVARIPAPAAVDETPPAAIRLLARLAQGGARGREETKSRMALMAHALKRGYRHLGEVLAEAGRLPDADLVFFFDRAELQRLVDAEPAEATGLVQSARQRREALSFQDSLEFEDVSVGRPFPLVAAPRRGATDDRIVGRPASRGTVEGVVRVAKSIVEAREVQRGEILVAPVTDVGWTPYFTVIGALVTDIGSSVSHGAVVAREYGLPCVVNTLVGTRVLRTGDRVRVDGDHGTVERLGPG